MCETGERTSSPDTNDADKLRVNSRIKHLILKDYLPTWATILGTWDKKLNYIDCFAGPGQYFCDGELVDGSPIVSIKECKELILSPTRDKRNKPNSINLTFIEGDENQRTKLQKAINSIPDIPSTLTITVIQGDSESIVKEIFANTKSLPPTFFFIDPYEHPFPLSFMQEIMKKDKSEIMVNFMYYQIIRDIDNPCKEVRCLKLFEPDDPRTLDIKTNGKFDSDKVLIFLATRIAAKYYIPFRVNFGPDEGVDSNRLKYFLIHYWNNFTAFNLMLNIMWGHSEENKPLMVSDKMPILFPLMGANELTDKILKTYKETGLKITFDAFVERNWQWYYLEKHYRSVLKDLEKNNIIAINRVTSKTKRGLSGEDIIYFKETLS